MGGTGDQETQVERRVIASSPIMEAIGGQLIILGIIGIIIGIFIGIFIINSSSV